MLSLIKTLFTKSKVKSIIWRRMNVEEFWSNARVGDKYILVTVINSGFEYANILIAVDQNSKNGMVIRYEDENKWSEYGLEKFEYYGFERV